MKFSLTVISLFVLHWAAFAQSDSSNSAFYTPPNRTQIIELIYGGHHEQARQLLSNMVATHGNSLAYEILWLQLAYQEGQENALAAMQQLNEQHPHNVNVLLAYGLLLWEEERYNEAESIYEQAEPLCDGQPTCQFILRKSQAALMKSRYQYQEAIDLYLLLYADYPNYYHVHFNLAYCYLGLGKPDLALKHSQAAYKMYDSFPAGNNLGLAYNMLGEYQKSLKIFKKLQKLEPDSYYVLCNMGYAYAQTGNLAEGLSMMHEAQKVCPEHCYIYRNLGVVYLKSDKQKACDYFAKALELDFTQQFGGEVLALQKQHCQ